MVCHDCGASRPVKHEIFSDLTLTLPVCPPSALLRIPGRLTPTSSISVSNIPLYPHKAPPGRRYYATNPRSSTGPSSGRRGGRRDDRTCGVVEDTDINALFVSVHDSNDISRKNNESQQSESEIRRVPMTSKLSLVDCLQKFTNTELLPDIECEHCVRFVAGKAGDGHLEPEGVERQGTEDGLYENPRVRTMAWKKLMVSRLPAILCLHISRHASAGTTMTKQTQSLSIAPVLDMEPFCDAIGLGFAVISSAVISSIKNSAMSVPSSSYVYDLCAVVVHEGTAVSGNI